MVTVLTRIGNGRLYVSNTQSHSQGEPSATFCFLSATSLSKDRLSLVEAGGLPGVYALAGRAAEGQFSALESLMREYLQSDPTSMTRTLLWTSNGSALRYRLAIKADGTVAANAELPLWEFQALPGKIKQKVRFSYWIPAGTVAVFDDDGMTLTHPDTNLRVRSTDSSIDLGVKAGRLQIDLSSGEQCSCISAELEHGSGSSFVRALGLHVNYFWKEGMFDKDIPCQLLATDPSNYQNVAIAVVLDPFSSAYPHSRCRFISPDTVLPSTLLDVKSRSLMLRPQTDSTTAHVAEIYFEQGEIAYPSLSGSFVVDVHGQLTGLFENTGVREVLAGSSGTELFQLGPDGYDGIRFVRGQAAYRQSPTLDMPPALTKKRTTAWIAPCKTGQRAASMVGGYRYVAQPEAQPLSSRRQARAARLAGQEHQLAFDPAPMTVYDETCLPILPMRSARKDDIVNALKIDREVLSPYRTALAKGAPPRDITVARAHALKTDVPTWITTPQGLLVLIDQNNEWQAIQIAASEPSSPSRDSWAVTIERPIENGVPVGRWALQEALSRSEGFVVITPMPAAHRSLPAFGTIRLHLKINGWEFDKDFNLDGDADAVVPYTGAEPQRRPAMVIKLGGGSVKSLAADPGKWSLPRSFNTDPAQAARDVQSAVQALYTLSRGESPIPAPPGPPESKRIPEELIPHYAALYARLVSSDWNGVVIFNIDAPAVPSDAAVILGGKQDKGSSFWVPALGVDLNRLAVQGQAIVPRKASVFAAIHQHDPTPLDEKGDTFEFKLRELNAVFENTELRCFLASMQLRLSGYFGGKTVQKGNSSRLLDITGRYEQHGGADGSGRYLFRALGTRTFNFEDGGLLQSLTVRRVDVTSSKEGNDAVSRFGMFGELAFTDTFTSVTSVRKIDFDNAGLIMRNSTFRVDAGQIRVEFKKGEGSSQGDSLMGSFPFSLAALRWSGGGAAISLPDIGFVPLDINMGGLDVPFDFALEFDLNLGTLGKLSDVADFLKGKILVGWQNASSGKGWTVGFRFDGGSGPLDIGINGVLRLRADKVSLKNYAKPHAGIGLALIHPQLEVMGTKIPNDPTGTLIAFIPAGKSQLGWAWADRDLHAGPVVLNWFLLGQRMTLATDIGPHATLPDIIKSWQDAVEIGAPDAGVEYDENAGWALVTEGKLGPLATRLVFLDGPGIYGLGVDIPGLANVDVVYRKLAADLGVFAGEITPAVRSFELGGANVTLPIFSFEAYTNGSWLINIGFNGNDFSRGTTVQVLPFLGSGGIRFGRTDWRSSYVLYGPDTTGEMRDLYRRLNLDPIIEFSLAARVGLGKFIDEGIFQAGAALSVYGIFEGALAVPRLGPSGPQRYIKLVGTAGILLEIFGVVNFAVISAVVSIRAWIEQGLTLESWQPITINAAAGVSVRVRFVVAEFRVFGRRIVIAIHFSFAYTARFSIKLDAKFDGNMPTLPGLRTLLPELAGTDEKSADPMDWVLHKLDGAKKEVSVAVSLEPTLGNARPGMLPMLFASHVRGIENPLANVAVDLLRWALRLSLGVPATAADPATVTQAQLRAMQERLRAPKGEQETSLSRWGAKPLNYAVVRAFLASRVQFKLMEVDSLRDEQLRLRASLSLAAVENAAGIQLPWFGDICVIAYSGSGNETSLRNLYGADRQDIDPAWEAQLRAALKCSRPDYKPEPSQYMKSSYLLTGQYPLDTSAKPVVDAIVEDWMASLILGITQRAIEVVGNMAPTSTTNPDPTVDLGALCARLLACSTEEEGHDSIALEVAQQASAFLHHGARVPAAPGNAGTDVALSELLRLEIGFDELPPDADTYLSFQPTAHDLFTGSVDLEKFDGHDAIVDLAAAAANVKASPITISVEVEKPVYVPRRIVGDKRIPLAPASGSGQALTYLPFPLWVEMKLAADTQQSEPLALSLQVEHEDDSNTAVTAPRWVSKIDLRLRQLPEGTLSALAGKQAAYAISGVDERVRAVLAAIRDDAAKVSVRAIYLAYRPAVGDPEKTSPNSMPLQFMQGKDAFVFVSNLSQEAAPADGVAEKLDVADDDKPVFAYLSDHEALIKLLLMASVVNGPGFQLGLIGDDPFKGMFDQAQVVTISVLIESALDGGQAGPQPYMDGVLFAGGELNGKDKAVFLAPGHLTARSNTPEGQIALIVERPNALPADDPTPPGAARDAKALRARFNLVDYAVRENAVFTPVSRAQVSAAGVDLSEEEHQALAQAFTQEPALWRHRIIVPLAQFAKKGIGRQPADPYALVGTDVSAVLKPGLRDGAGHVLPDDMLQVSVWKNSIIKYRTPITRFEEFAGASAGWIIGSKGGKPVLSLTLAWTLEDLIRPTLDNSNIPAARLAALRAEFERLAMMCRGPGFSAKADFRIGGKSLGQIDCTNEFADWVAKIASKLAAPDPTQLPLGLSIALEALPSSLDFEPHEVKLAFMFERDKALCDDIPGIDPDVQAVTSIVSPYGTTGRIDWNTLATAFHEAYGDRLTLLRRVGASGTHGSVWVLPGRALSGLPSTVKTGEATFLAPEPLGKAFMSGTVELTDLSGSRRSLDAVDVDLNLLGENAATMLERFLSPRAAQTLCRLPNNRFSMLMAAKRQIALAMTERLRPVFAGAATRQELQEAIDKFRNAAGADLRSAFGLTVGVHVKLDKSGPPGLYLYGATGISTNAATQPTPYKVSPMRVPLDQGGISGAFTFVAGWAKTDEARAAVLQGALRFVPRYVEKRDEGSAFNDYVPSDWYEIVWARATDRSITFTPADGKTEWQIPLPLRQVPPTPMVLRHGAATCLDVSAAKSIEDFVRQVRTWNYQVDLAVPGQPQDRAYATVEFNPNTTFGLANQDGLFEALVAYSANESALTELLKRLEAGTGSDTEVSRACDLFMRIGQAMSPMSAVAAHLNADGNLLKVGIESSSLSDKQWQLRWNTDSDMRNQVTVSLMPFPSGSDQAMPSPIPPTSQAPGQATYATAAADAAIKGGAGLSVRRLNVSDLDIFTQPTASTIVQVRRNETLAGKEVSPVFVFDTMQVRTAEPIVPHVRIDEAFDITQSVTAANIVAFWIGKLETALFDGHDDVRPGYSIDVRAALHCPFGANSEAFFSYPLASMVDVAAVERGWTSVWALELEAAIAGLDPVARLKASLNIDLKVYSTLNRGKPVMSLSRLVLPLSKVSSGTHVGMLYADQAALRVEPTPRAIAEILFAETCALDGATSEMALLRRTLADFALTYRGEGLRQGRRPAASELELDAAFARWKQCLADAQAVSDQKRLLTADDWRALTLWTADRDGERPAPGVEPWFDAAQSAGAAVETLRIAGPFTCHDVSAGLPVAAPLYLWGCRLRRVDVEESERQKIGRV